MIYKIVMSKGDEIKIDEDDLVKIKANIGESLIQIKQAIINPSFMIAIIPTDEQENRVKDLIEIRDGRAVLTGTETIKKLVDKMTIKNKKLLS